MNGDRKGEVKHEKSDLWSYHQYYPASNQHEFNIVNYQAGILSPLSLNASDALTTTNSGRSTIKHQPYLDARHSNSLNDAVLHSVFMDPLTLLDDSKHGVVLVQGGGGGGGIQHIMHSDSLPQNLNLSDGLHISLNGHHNNNSSHPLPPESNESRGSSSGGSSSRESSSRRLRQETSTQRQERLRKNAERGKLRRLEESDEQRERRLKRNAERGKMRRQEESTDKRQERLRKNAERQKMRRLRESPEERQLRLWKNAERQRVRRGGVKVEFDDSDIQYPSLSP